MPVSPFDEEVESEEGEGEQERDEGVVRVGQDQPQRQVRQQRDPGQPTAEERRLHDLTHLPYRSWCRDCVRGRGYAHPHRSLGEGADRPVPTVSMDYFYMGTRDQGEGLTPMMAIKDSNSKAVSAFVAPCKGADPYTMRKLGEFFNFLGYERCILKCDQEPAIVDLQNKFKDSWHGDLALENSPVGESPANGGIEAGVKTIESQIRVMKSALDNRYNIAVDGAHPIITWLVLHAGTLITHHGIGRDGKSPYHLVKGRDSNKCLYEFGECVQYKPLGKDKHRYKLDPKLYDGIFLGMNSKSGEYFVGTEIGVKKARDIYRVAKDERFNVDTLNKFKGLPWKMTPEEEGDEEVPEMIDEGPVAEEGPRAQDGGDRLYKPRREKIGVPELRKYWFTKGRQGCSARRLGTASRPHSEACRNRIRQAAADDELFQARIRASQQRQDKFIAQEIERADNSRKRPADSQPSEPQPNTARLPQSEPSSSASASASTAPPQAPEQPVKFRRQMTQQETQHDTNMETATAGNSTPSTTTIQDISQPAVGDPYQQLDASMDSLIKILGKWGVNEDHLTQRIDELRDVSRCMQIMGVDVSEIYSPPRIVAMATRMGLTPGTSFDIQVNDENGEPWDFNVPAQRERARARIIEEEPKLLVGSPMCTAFSILQQLNANKGNREEKNKQWEQALTHLNFCVELYKLQYNHGRYFLHEHPASASSWQRSSIMELYKLSGVDRVVSHMCAFGMKSSDSHGDGLVYKPTGWMSNSPCILQELNKQCTNRLGGEQHRHVHLVDGRARQAAIYPEQVCTAVLTGLRAQLIKDHCMDAMGVGLIAEEEEDEQYDNWEQYFDDVSGRRLCNKMVMAARREEILEFKRLKVYDVVPIEESYNVTGKELIKVRFVDMNKGDEQNPNYRSRLVAKEFRDGSGYSELFAGMPPLEAKKLLVSLAASNLTHNNKPLKLAFIDIKKAYLYARARRAVYVELPPGEEQSGMCARLNVSLYGTRDAAQNWEYAYTEVLEGMGYTRGVSTPCAFYNRDRGTRVVVHGDDFTLLANDDEIQHFADELRKHFSIKLRGILGDGQGECSEIVLLNRVIRYTSTGIDWEADPRHSEIICTELGLSCDSKGSAIPGGKAKAEELDQTEPLSPSQATKYRALVARANYLAQDRCDIQFAVKELTRRMSRPLEEDWQKLKKLGRYLSGRARVVVQFKFQELPNSVNVWVDSDWAGCLRTRRSTIGGGIRVGGHTVKTWSSTQAIVATSSGEAEYHGVVKGASALLGFRALAADLGVQFEKGNVHTDSSAAKGIAHRVGLGKLRHLDVQLLWIQDRVRRGDFKVVKVPGSSNPADLMTKFLTEERIQYLTEEWSYVFQEGRAASAPSII